MTITLPPKEQEFTPIPAGNHFATCYRIIDLGTQEVDYMGKSQKQHKIMISWELRSENMDDGRPFTASKRYTLSSSDKGNLRRDLESWRGKPFTETEFGTFDLGVLLGVNCFLNIVHEEKNGSTYSNITSVTSLPKGMGLTLRQETTNKMVYFSLNKFDQAIYDALSENVKAIIAKSPEYQRLKGAHEIDHLAPDGSSDVDADALNEDIPF